MTMPGRSPAFMLDLNRARTHRPNCRYVITAASDTPFLPANLVSRLRAVIGEEKPKPIVARSEAGLHPVFGLWPVALAADLEDSLRTGAGKVSDWVRQRYAEELVFPAVEAGGRNIDPFFNINRPDELATAEAFLRASAA